MSAGSWVRHVDLEEAGNWYACICTAQGNGHSAEEAENCDAGSVGCPDCPFIRRDMEAHNAKE